MTADHAMTVEFTIHDPSGFCHDLPTLLACARAGAHSWAALPAPGPVDVAVRPRKVEEVLAMCDDLEEAFERAVVGLEERWKAERRELRREAREAVA